MDNFNIDDLQSGLNFIFLGPNDYFKAIYNQFEDMSNVYFVQRLETKNLTDKFVDESSFIIIDNDLNPKILEVINFPQIELDWNSAVKIFIKNYNTIQPSNNQYKWGQMNHDSREIMCANCGYIVALKEGETYPICEACHSGLPESPTEPDVEFWINI
jgi:hypothetical protein